MTITESQHHNGPAVQPQEFKGRNGKTYIYDFDLLTFAQVMHAEAVFSYAQEKIMNPPSRFEDVKMTGGLNWLSRAFSHLLVERLPDGEISGYELTRVDRVQDFIETQLSSRDFRRLTEDCKADFFDKAGLVDAVSLRQLKMQLQPLIGLLSENPTGIKALSGSEQSEKLSESTDSMSQANSVGD